MKKWGRSLGTVGLGVAFTLASACGGQLPASKGAPQVGQKAPDFTLLDSYGKPVKLSELLAPVPTGRAAPNSAAPAAGDSAAAKKASWLLLIFYRGYW